MTTETAQSLRGWTSEAVGSRTILRCYGAIVGGYETHGLWRGSINPQRVNETIALHGSDLTPGHKHTSVAPAVREVVQAWLARGRK